LDREPRFLFTTPDGFPWVTSTNPNSIMNGYSVGYSKLLSEISILRRSLILQI
jgi:hypothetical protein